VLEDRVILKNDNVFVVSDVYGDIPADSPQGLGLYRADTRFLSCFELKLNGRRPILLNQSTDRGFVATFQLVNPKLDTASGVVPMQTLSLRRTRFVLSGLHERIGIQNCGQEHVQLELELHFKADFEDIFEVRGFEPAEMGRRQVDDSHTDERLSFCYEGADGVSRRTDVTFDIPVRIGGTTARAEISLQPQETFVLALNVLPLIGDQAPDPELHFEKSLAQVESGYRDWRQSCTVIRTDNEQLDRALIARSQQDLRMLCDNLPTGLLPTAGTPWYAVPFGRDALIASLQTLALNPDIARGTLRFLAQHQGKEFNEFREEQPGKILHEIRFGELANLQRVPHTPFYGTCDATPLFLVLLVELLEWTGDLEFFAELLPNARAALAWIDRHGDLDGDGFIEYTYEPFSVRNQNWKDSSDSLTDSSGRAPKAPIAPVEVQAYVYRAKRGLAHILKHLGLAEEAQTLEREAEVLLRRFNEAFWLPRERFYAQALDAAKAPITSISSNVGHALWGGIVEHGSAPDVVMRLMSPEMYSGWGVRTLSTHAVSYNPMSYHNGSVWPHDNSIVAAGLAAYGFQAQAEVVARAVLEAGLRLGSGSLPELFCGFPRDMRFNSGPVEYLVSCHPQAWAAGSVFEFLRTLAGLRVDALGGFISIDPIPTSLYRRLRLQGLRAAGGVLDFTIEQDPAGLHVDVHQAPDGVAVEMRA
jgi:glycogen debranching enzyme